MADAAIDFQGVDLFGLGSTNFKALDGTKQVTNATYMSENSLGDEHAKFIKEDKIDFTCNYDYVGDDFQTDFAHLLGVVYTGADDDVLLDSAVFTFAERSVIKVALTGHNHNINPHTGAVGSGTGAAGSATEGADNNFAGFDLDLSTILGATALSSEDCPTQYPFPNSNADTSQIGVTLSYTTEHTDVQSGDGEHFAGRSFNGQLSISSEFVGTPTLTTTGFTVESTTDGNGNKVFDNYSITATKKLARTAA